MARPPAVLSIAGSDPSGGAGIQADLKTFSALGAYGMAAVTTLTAQNTRGVQGVWPVPSQVLRAQLDSVLGDLRIDAVKIGVIGSPENADVIGWFLKEIAPQSIPVVIDPVLRSSSGAFLADGQMVEPVRDLLPLVSVLTPNLAEAAALTGAAQAGTQEEMISQAQVLRGLGAPAVLMKGGHLDGPAAIDLWIDEHGVHRLDSRRVDTPHTHGTGCALSSALAALRPQRPDWESTLADAKDWMTEAIRAASHLELGSGTGPVHHLHRQW